jgi:hypothetical protein
MTWAQQCLKRVFGIDIEACPACGGAVRIIGCIGDADVIEKILNHLEKKTPESPRRWPVASVMGWFAGRIYREWSVYASYTPMDTAINLANDQFYLDNHLKDVVARREQQGEVEIVQLLGGHHRR